MSAQQLQSTENRHSMMPATVGEIEEQVQLIQHLMKRVMKEDTHYGTIPGTDKPTLYKPGAEKICLTFRLTPRFEVQREDLPGGHREYTVVCRLEARDGTPIAEGIGVCSTMEGKYRYRWDPTGQRVPSEYWDSRDPHLLGGPSFAPRKIKGTWMIFQRIDHDNPADYYNTVAKMAKKRAHIDATLTGTAASDCFEQDLDDIDGIPPTDPPGQNTQSNGNGGRRQQPRADASNGDKPIGDGPLRMIRTRLKDATLTEQEACKRFGVDKLEALKMGQVNDVLAWIDNPAGE